MRLFDTEHKAMAAAFMACFFFGFSFVFSKVALETVTPAQLLSFRFLLAFLMLSVFLLTGKVKLKLKGKNLLPLIALGLLQPVIYFLCENYGIQMTTATFSAVIISLIPVATLLGGILFLREIPTVLQIIFLLMSVGGVMIMAGMQGGEGTVTVAGVLLLLGAVVSQAAFTALSRRLSTVFSVFERTYVMFIVGLVVFVPIALWEADFQAASLLSTLKQPSVWAAVIYLGAFCSVGSFLFLNYANTHLPVARTTAFSNITTVISVFAGVVFLKESFNTATIIASFMIIIGVWGVQRFKKKVSAEE